MVVPGGLPAQPTPLIGRDREVAHVRALLLSPEIRLLTLLEPVVRARHGWRLLSPPIWSTRSSIGLPMSTCVPLPALPTLCLPSPVPWACVTSALVYAWIASASIWQPRDLLLVLDNFEHVLGAAPQLAELLTTCPGLKMLVTSRAALHLCWEQELPVEPLDVPDASRHPLAASIKDVSSVALFVQRAKSARPDFAFTDQNAAAFTTGIQT